MTYDSLVEDLKNYTNRGDDTRFVTQCPRFVMLAEHRIASEVRGLGYIKAASAVFSTGASAGVIAKPEGWRETVSFSYLSNSQRLFLKGRSYEYCRTFWPNASSKLQPRFYADYDYQNWLVVPTPDLAYSFEVLYHEKPVPLSEANQVNWTTDNAPQLLLFACLLEAVPFLKDYEVQPTWQAAFDRAAAAVLAESQRRVQDRSEQRSET